MASDLYTRAIAKVLGIPENTVTAELRNEAKVACFTALYRYAAKERTDEELFEEVCDVLRLIWKDRGTT